MSSRDTIAFSVTSNHWATVTNSVDVNSSSQMGDKIFQLSSPWRCIYTSFLLARDDWYRQTSCSATRCNCVSARVSRPAKLQKILCPDKSKGLLYWLLDFCKTIWCHLDSSNCLPYLDWNLCSLLKSNGSQHELSKGPLADVYHSAHLTMFCEPIWLHPHHPTGT